MDALGFEFYVLPNVFVVCGQHAPSSSYEKTFGVNSDPMRILYLKALYSKFKKELKSKDIRQDSAEKIKYFEEKKKQSVVLDVTIGTPTLINGC